MSTISPGHPQKLLRDSQRRKKNIAKLQRLTSVDIIQYSVTLDIFLVGSMWKKFGCRIILATFEEEVVQVTVYIVHLAFHTRLGVCVNS